MQWSRRSNTIATFELSKVNSCKRIPIDYTGIDYICSAHIGYGKHPVNAIMHEVEMLCFTCVVTYSYLAYDISQHVELNIS